MNELSTLLESSNGMAIISVELLGPPRVCIDGHPCKFRIKRSEALLFYCLDARRPLGRLHLADLFWPGDEYKALAGLSDALYRLRDDLKTGGQQYLLTTRQTVAFDLDCRHRYDVAEFEQFAEGITAATPLPDLERALALYRGPFLDTFYVTGADVEFDDWISARQQTLERHYYILLYTLSLRYLARGDYRLATQYLQRLHTENAEEQAVYGLLMVCYAGLGEDSLVEQAYQQYIRLMTETLQVQPDAGMIQLYEAVQHGHLAQHHTQALVAQAVQLPHALHLPPLQAAWRAVLSAIKVETSLSESPAYQQVLCQAQQEARQLGCHVIGIPHLFLALCAGDETRALPAETCDTLAVLLQAIRYILGISTNLAQVPTVYTLELQHLLQQARDMAQQAGATSLSIAYLWSALCAADHPWLGQVVQHYGLQLADIRAAHVEE